MNALTNKSAIFGLINEEKFLSLFFNSDHDTTKCPANWPYPWATLLYIDFLFFFPLRFIP